MTNVLVGKTQGEKIWTNGEMSVIAASILSVIWDNDKRLEFQNMTNVYWFLAEMNKQTGNKTPMQEYIKRLPQHHPARAITYAADMLLISEAHHPIEGPGSMFCA